MKINNIQTFSTFKQTSKKPYSLQQSKKPQFAQNKDTIHFCGAHQGLIKVENK